MKIGITIFLFFIVQLIAAQTAKIDSLLNIAKSSTGEIKIIALSDASKALYNKNPNKGIEYGNEALKLAEEEKSPKLRSKIYNSLGLNYFAKSELVTARNYFEKAMKDAVFYNDSVEIATSYNRFGLIYQVTGKFDSAIIVFNKQFEIEKIRRNIDGAANCLYNIGTIHLIKGESKSALSALLESKSLYESLNNLEKIAALYLRIGAIYSDTENYADAEKFVKIGIKNCLELKNISEATIGINALGVIYKKQGKLDDALIKYNEALNYLEELPNKSVLMIVYSNIGTVYTTKKEYKSAKEYHQKSLALGIEINAANSIAISNYNIGEIEYFEKNYVLAGKYIDKAVVTFNENKSLQNLISSYEKLIVINKALNNSEKTIKYYDLLTSTKDSFFLKEKTNTLDSLQIVFKTKELEQENKIFIQRNELQDKTIVNQRIILIFSFLTAILLLILAKVTLRKRKKIKLASEDLEISYLKINEKAKELQELNIKLIELDTFKEGLMQMIVHDLKNPLNILINIKEFDSKDEQMDIVMRTSNQMLNLVQNILDVHKFENLQMKLDIENVSALKLVDLAHKEVSYLLANKNLKLIKNIPPSIGIKCDIQIMLRVMTNLLTNAIKYSPLNSEIKVEAIVSEFSSEIIQLSVMDKGKGIPKEYHERIFEKFSNINVQNGEKIRSSSIGLSFCKLAVESHGGKIRISQKEELGTEFVFTVQKATEFQDYGQDIYLDISIDFTFSEEEIEYLSLYIDELRNIPIYKISLLNSMVEKIKESTDSLEIIRWCDYIYHSALNANKEKYLQLLDYSGKNPV